MHSFRPPTQPSFFERVLTVRASSRIEYIIGDEVLLQSYFQCIQGLVFTRGILPDGFEDISIFHIYHLQSQFEPRLIYNVRLLEKG